MAMTLRIWLVALAVTLLWTGSVGAAGKEPSEAVAQAGELLDAGRAEEALARLDGYLARRPDDAEALFLRSTARFLLGDNDGGAADLSRSLELDPAQRQGWLHLGALAIANESYDEALEAFGQAERLAPGEPDNDLNIGAVHLLAGRLEPATRRFKEYLEQGEPAAESFYLVATNYALAGYAALAVEHLGRAVELNERFRLKAKTDPNFLDLSRHPSFERLMVTDVYQPPPGAYREEHVFAAPYGERGAPLLTAVLDTLQLAGVPFDPAVEVTPAWALIWGEIRIKVAPGPEDGQGTVELSAPADRMAPGEWQRRVAELLAGIEERLASG